MLQATIWMTQVIGACTPSWQKDQEEEFCSLSDLIFACGGTWHMFTRSRLSRVCTIYQSLCREVGGKTSAVNASNISMYVVCTWKTKRLAKSAEGLTRAGRLGRGPCYATNCLVHVMLWAGDQHTKLPGIKASQESLTMSRRNQTLQFIHRKLNNALELCCEQLWASES